MSSFSERGRERRESDSVPDRTLATPCERLGTGARQFRTGDRRSAKAARVSVRIRYGGLTVNGFTMNSPNGVYHSIVRPLGTSPRPVREVWVGWLREIKKKRAFLYLWMPLVRLAKSQLRTEHIWDRMLNVRLLSPRSISPKRTAI
jgi:hypothetical protein